MLTRRHAITHTTLPTPDPTAPIHMLTPDHACYTDMLRAIGRHLDTLRATDVTVFEVQDGLAWQAFPHGDLAHPETAMLSFDQLSHLREHSARQRHARLEGKTGRGHRHQPRPPLCPDGYAETFRSMGSRLDQANAHTVLITECRGTLILSYHTPIPEYRQRSLPANAPDSAHYQNSFSPEQLHEMVKESTHNRRHRLHSEA